MRDIMTEAKCAIVIDFIHFIWALKSRLPILAILVLFYHDQVSYAISIWSPFGVLSLVILLYNVLSPLFNVLPIGFKTYIMNRVAIKYQLHGCGTLSGMYCCLHGKAYRNNDAGQCAILQILLTGHILTSG